MRHRLTARVLLFGPDGRILLLKGRMPNRPRSSGAWHTPGGGVEAGETLEQAALREVAEETGFTQVNLGPVVWTREGEGVLVGGETVLFKESYFVAQCTGGEPSRDGWADYEIGLIDDIQWWTLDALSSLTDPIYPERLLELLPGVAAGVYPPIALDITVARIARPGEEA